LLRGRYCFLACQSLCIIPPSSGMSTQTGRNGLISFWNSIISTDESFVDNVSATSLSWVLLFYDSYLTTADPSGRAV
jgi:hypothetical protein